MAFPSTGVIDAFTGSDEDPVATNWTGPVWPGEGQFRRVSNALQMPLGVGDAQGYYDVDSFAEDQEVYATINYLSISDEHRLGLYARLSEPNTTTFKAYVLFLWYVLGVPTLRLLSYIDLSSTDIGSDMALTTWVDGDKIGMSCIGDNIKCYHYTSGAWVEMGSFTDTTVTGAGYLGLVGYGSEDISVDDLGGGAFALGQTLLPDADIQTTGWTATPLFSKLADSSDATFITSTAA